MATLGQILDRLEERDFNLSQAHLDYLFRELNAAHGSVYGETLKQYVLNGPETTREFFKTQCLALARKTLDAYSVQVPGIYVLIGDLLVPTKDMIKYWEQFARDIPNAPEQITFSNCLRCGSQARIDFFPIYHPDTYPMQRTAVQFDYSDIATQNAVSVVSQGLGLNRNIQPISGICRNCFKSCPQCGVKPQPRITADDLTAFLFEGTCAACGADTIVKLPLPKPSVKELKTFRGKLISFGEGVR